MLGVGLIGVELRGGGPNIDVSMLEHVSPIELDNIHPVQTVRF